MDKLVKDINENAKFYFVVLVVIVIDCIVTITQLGFWLGLGAIFFLYFALSLYVYSVVEPKEWEASIVFVLYLIAAIVFIGAFSGLSLAHEDLFDDLNTGFWEHAYYSASMFTSLGYADFKPKSFEAKFFTAAQSLLGGAHGVSFIFVMLGRSKWTEHKIRKVVDVSGNIRALEQRMRDMSRSMNFVIALLALNLLVMLFLLVS